MNFSLSAEIWWGVNDDPTRTADYGYFPWERDNVDTDDLAQRRSEEAMQREVDDMESVK